jgi:hypothetical protein
MADEWKTVTIDQLAVGDRVRYRGDEFEIARIDTDFLKIPTMVCLIEDTPQRWHAYPAQRMGEIERLH